MDGGVLLQAAAFGVALHVKRDVVPDHDGEGYAVAFACGDGFGGPVGEQFPGLDQVEALQAFMEGEDARFAVAIAGGEHIAHASPGEASLGALGVEI